MAGWRTTFGSLAQGNQSLSLFDQQFNDVGLLTIVPCTATGTNTVALAPNGYTAAQSSYANNQRYGFVAAANSTAAVTLNVNSIGALKLYLADGVTQAAAGALVAGVYYDVVYNSALNSGGGGFQLVAPNGSGGIPWTPTVTGLTNTGGAPTIEAEYNKIGNIVHWNIQIIPVTSTSSVAGVTTFSLPSAPAVAQGGIAQPVSTQTASYGAGLQYTDGNYYSPTWTGSTFSISLSGWYFTS